MPDLKLVAEAGVAEAPHDRSETGREDRPRLALVDPSRLRRDCLRLAVLGEGWHVTDMPAVRDLLGRLWRGETFSAILIGGARGAETAVAEIARLAAAAPLVPILVAAEDEDRRYAERLRSAGARGVLPANTGLGMLVAALTRLRCGTDRVSGRTPPGAARSAELPLPSSLPRPLTRRQREVLALISQGKSNRLIAVALALSEDTVKVHVKEIIKRLKVKNRTQAALVATGAACRISPAFPRSLAEVS